MKHNLDIYSRNDDQVVPILAIGGCGVVSEVANILPKDTHNILGKYFNGDLIGAFKLQLKMLPFI